MVLPMTATLATLRTSWSVNIAPSAIGQLRIVGVVGRLAHDLGVPVEAVGEHLGAVAHLRADADDAGDLAL